MKSPKKITLVLPVHRPEMIPLIADWMRRHDAIFLEEPPADGFEPMLAGALSVDDYLRPLDVEYPAFSRDMCYLHYPFWRLLRKQILVYMTAAGCFPSFAARRVPMRVNMLPNIWQR